MKYPTGSDSLGQSIQLNMLSQIVIRGDAVEKKSLSQHNALLHPLYISPLSRILVIGALQSISLHSPCHKSPLADLQTSICCSHSHCSATKAEKNNEKELTGRDKDREITHKLQTQEKKICLGKINLFFVSIKRRLI